MGAATRPPVASLAPLWRSTITATATLASPGGPAKPMIQACERRREVPSWAVPVLPPTSKPGIARRVAVPPLHDLDHGLAHGVGGLRADRRLPDGRVVAFVTSSPLLSRISSSTWGVMIVPCWRSPARPAPSAAAWLHVVLPDRRLGQRRQVLHEVGREERGAGAGRSIGGLSLKPKACAPGDHGSRAEVDAHLGEGTSCTTSPGCRTARRRTASPPKLRRWAVGLGRGVRVDRRVDRLRLGDHAGLHADGPGHHLERGAGEERSRYMRGSRGLSGSLRAASLAVEALLARGWKHVGVVARIAPEREERAGLRVDGDDRALAVAELLPGDLLHVLAQRQLHVAGAVLVDEQVRQRADLLIRGPTGQLVVVRRLEPGRRRTRS